MTTFKDISTVNMPVIDIGTATTFIQQLHLKLLHQQQQIAIFEEICTKLLEIKNVEEVKTMFIAYGLINEPEKTPSNVRPLK